MTKPSKMVCELNPIGGGGIGQVEITGIATSVSCPLLTTNSAPLKNVPTAVPNRIGPKMPFNSRNT